MDKYIILLTVLCIEYIKNYEYELIYCYLVNLHRNKSISFFSRIKPKYFVWYMYV